MIFTTSFNQINPSDYMKSQYIFLKTYAMVRYFIKVVMV